jgi:hypothetical protein
MRRRDLTPIVDTEDGSSLDDVIEHLRAWHADTLETIERLHVCRQQVVENTKQLESPNAAFDFIDFFIDLFGRAAADFDRVAAELPQGVERAHLDALRQIASNAAAEQRRGLMFRDKWINKPLPYEEMRPLLTQISNDTRNQLGDYRELNSAAARLETLAGSRPKPPDEGRTLDRRALFTRWFGR